MMETAVFWVNVAVITIYFIGDAPFSNGSADAFRWAPASSSKCAPLCARRAPRIRFVLPKLFWTGGRWPTSRIACWVIATPSSQEILNVSGFLRLR
jgi:hypothetical protein